MQMTVDTLLSGLFGDIGILVFLKKLIFWSVIVQFLDVLFRDINEVYTLHSEPPANELALRSSTSRMKPNPTSITSRLLTL
jgi:hypothetical protein